MESLPQPKAAPASDRVRNKELERYRYPFVPCLADIEAHKLALDSASPSTNPRNTAGVGYPDLVHHPDNRTPAAPTKIPARFLTSHSEPDNSTDSGQSQKAR